MNQALTIVLRWAAPVGLAVLVAPGCSAIYTFEREPSAEIKYHCEAEVIDDLDLRRTIYSYDDTSHEGTVLSQCFLFWEELEIDSLIDLQEAWHTWLDEAIEADGWCIVAGSISCEEAGALGHDSCPAVTLRDEVRDFCSEEIGCCIQSAPAEIDFEALQEAAGMNRWTPVGTTSSIEPAGFLRNQCDREVSFRPRDGLVGDHPGDFELVGNTCVVPEPPEDHPDGLTLGPLGSADDFCTYQVRFSPTMRGPRSARMEFVQSDSSACTIADMVQISGRGRAGTLSGIPGEICLGELAGLRCTAGSNWVLTNDGPGIVTVESVDVTGNFELLTADSFELIPGASTTVTVRWCTGIAGNVDEDGTLTIVGNASDAEILVPLTRLAAGCP